VKGAVRARLGDRCSSTPSESASGGSLRDPNTRAFAVGSDTRSTSGSRTGLSPPGRAVELVSPTEADEPAHRPMPARPSGLLLCMESSTHDRPAAHFRKLAKAQVRTSRRRCLQRVSSRLEGSSPCWVRAQRRRGRSCRRDHAGGTAWGRLPVGPRSTTPLLPHEVAVRPCRALGRGGRRGPRGGPR
jgi:hypothetical protein